MVVNHLPIIYVRGYAGTQADVEETVDDPFYGFNIGSTHVRQDQTGKATFFAFQSPFVRLARNYGYAEVFDGPNQRVTEDCRDSNRTIWIYRYYDPTSRTFDRPGGARLTIEQAAAGLAEFIDFRGGLAFLDTRSRLVKWMNCSIDTAIMPTERSRNHETVTQESLVEV